MKTLLLVNTLTEVNSFIYANHIEFFMRAKKDIPDNQMLFFTPHRMPIDRARNMAAMQALALECDYLMFLDDDVMVPPDAFKKLYEADKDIIAGLVMIRGVPFNVMAFNEARDDKGEILMRGDGTPHLKYFNDLPKNEDGKLVELAECQAVGFSCCLINMNVIKALEPPYFITGPNYTEDVFFCKKAKESLNPVPSVFVHTGVECGHLLPPEPIQYSTREVFLKFYEGLQELEKAKMHELGISTEAPKNNGRDLDYITRCLKNL